MTCSLHKLYFKLKLNYFVTFKNNLLLITLRITKEKLKNINIKVVTASKL